MLFGKQKSVPEKRGEYSMAARPRLTIQELEGIRRQVRLNPLAGKGSYTVDQLENDALLAHYNTVVMADTAETLPPAPSPSVVK